MVGTAGMVPPILADLNDGEPKIRTRQDGHIRTVAVTQKFPANKMTNAFAEQHKAFCKNLDAWSSRNRTSKKALPNKEELSFSSPALPTY